MFRLFATCNNIRYALLTTIVKAGGFGAITPASWSMFSRRLPASSHRATRRATARYCWKS